MARRRRAREVALQMLFQRDFNPEIAAHAVRSMIEEQIPEEALRQFAWQLFAGVIETRPMLDEQIEAAAKNWTLKRMAPIDRNILRMGTWELLFTDTPHQVVIDEAVELAKRYGTAQSSQFVNGILDRLVPSERRRPKTP
ncbi:MAG TPA: transcription antitermination factor NusB [Planctomycetaceae bacterium]|nr:transcription antitermination factor NusB [Planctomycetaceae bacterium]